MPNSYKFRLHFTWLLVFLFFICKAQDTLKPRSYSTSLGVALPLNNFASNDTNSNGAGFASRGLSYKITFGYNFSKRLGLQAQFLYTRNDVNKFIQDIFSPTRFGPWETANFLAGIKFPGYIKPFSIEPYLLSGLSLNFSPNVLLIDNTIGLKRKRAVSLPLQAGIAFKYYLKCITLGVSIDYFDTYAKFGSWQTNRNSIIAGTAFNQTYELIMINGMIGFDF